MKVELPEFARLGSVPKQHAYVDEVASLRNAAWLIESQEFDYPAFGELCNLLEAIVLYERLYSCPLEKRCDGLGKGPSFVIVDSPTVKKLVSHSVLAYIDWPTDVLFEDAPHTEERERYQVSLKAFEKGKSRGTIHIEYLHGVGMASRYGMHIHPSLSNTKGYLQLLKVEQALRATGALMEAYQAMSKSAARDIQSIIRERGTFTVCIPPIPLEILKRSSKPEDIVDEALNLRHVFAPLRATYREYAATIADENVPIEVSLRARRTLQTILSEVSSPYGTGEKRRVLEWTSVADMAQAAPEVAGGHPGGLLNILLGKPLEWVCHWLSRRGFMQLFRLKRSAFRTVGYSSQIRRVWGKAVDFAGQPPLVLDENVDYPRGSGWTIYEGDRICLWSWSGRWVGFRVGDHLFSPDERHIGRFFGTEVYAPDGRYLGELCYGRLLSARKHLGKSVAPYDRIERHGIRPCGPGDREPREFPREWDDFPSL